MADTSALRGKLAERADQTKAVEPAKAPTISDLINRQRSEIARALPKHMDADRLARIATTVIKTTPKLMECSAESLLGALMLSAQTGMEPGPLGHVYFVPRRIKGQMECQWMLGYKGIIELARRSGNLVSIEAREVCAEDHFVFQYGLDEKLEHEPYMGAGRGDIVAFWGLARFKDGGHYFIVMSRSDVDEARDRSDSAKAGFGPWISDYAAMGRKTVVRRMMPFLPLASEQAQVIARDEAVTRIGAGDRIAKDIAADAPDSAWIEAEEVMSDQVDTNTGEVLDVEEIVDGPGDSPGPGLSAEFEPMTQAQSRKIHACLREMEVPNDKRHQWATDALGRQIESFNDISKREAMSLIDELEAA